VWKRGATPEAIKRSFRKAGPSVHPGNVNPMTPALKPSFKEASATGLRSALRSEKRPNTSTFGPVTGARNWVAVLAAWRVPRLSMSISGVTATSTISSRPCFGASVVKRAVPASQVRPGGFRSPAAFPRRIPSGFGGPRTHIRANLDAESHDQPQLRRGLSNGCERAWRE